MLKILKQVDETPSIKTVTLAGGMEAAPGQFVMVWVPGVDEFPMSLSYIGQTIGITYQVVGEGTRGLASKDRGDLVGIRGPYGRGFELKGRRLLVVAGGTGMAALAPFVAHASRAGKKVDVVIGARTGHEILFDERASRAGATIHISTDDGSEGYKGLATDLAAQLMRENSYDHAYTCGPERMIARLVDMCSRRRIPLQASLERIMKCGIGLCDSCAIDGAHVCREGPVFELKDLRRFDDLGKTKLDLSGRKTPV